MEIDKLALAYHHPTPTHQHISLHSELVTVAPDILLYFSSTKYLTFPGHGPYWRNIEERDNCGHDGSSCGPVASYDEQFKLLNQFNEDR